MDNPGLLVGSPREEIQSAVVTLDVTMDTVEYASKEIKSI